MSIINKSNTNKFKSIFSNVPVPSSRVIKKVDMHIFNSYVKAITLPDYSLEIAESFFQGEVLKTPVSIEMSDYSPITIDFIADEDLENYITLFEWIRELRCGNSYTSTTTARNYNINSLIILMQDNQNRTTSTIEFKDLLLINLSSLNITFGTSEPLIFSTTFQYRSWDITRTTKTLNN